jgi:hypothetical protein
MYEDDITKCTESCWIIGKHSDKESVIEEVNLIKVKYMLAWNTIIKLPEPSIYALKNEQEGKTGTV